MNIIGNNAIRHDFNSERAFNMQSPYKQGMPPAHFVSFMSEYISCALYEQKDTYQNVINHFADYEKHSGKKIMSNHITAYMLLDFMDYLQLTKGLKRSTSRGIIVRMKTLLKLIYEEGYAVNNSYKKAKADPGETFAIALTPFQINQIFLCEKYTEKEREIADMFVFLCHTGLRYSDAKQIRTEHRDGNIFIKKTQKTKVTVYVPIDPCVEMIWKRYGNKLPPTRSTQQLNHAMKMIARKAGLIQTISYEVDIAGEVKMVSKPLYMMISSHTGRRSYVTNELRKGNGIEKIQPVTGHKSAACLLGYNKLSKERNARIMASKEY